MIFERTDLETCKTAQGVVVVIDVLRAFSTAAYAFGQGTNKITLVSAIEEAFTLRKQFPSARLMGEINGLSIPGFDYNNSPASILSQDLKGSHLIHRSSAGTQGVTSSIRASTLMAASFCCAAATARFIVKGSPQKVTFVITGKGEGLWGDEDEACADYLECLLKGSYPEPEKYLRRVYESLAARKFIVEKNPDTPEMDLKYCTALDRFTFAMQVKKQGGLFTMLPVFV